MACFTHERKHRVIKKWASNRRNTTSYEVGLLEEVLGDQLNALEGLCLNRKLLDMCTHPPSKELARPLRELFPEASALDAIRTASAAMCDGVVSVGDVAFCRDDDGVRRVVEVMQHMEVQGKHMSIVSVWELMSKGDRVEKHRVSEKLLLVKTDQLMMSLTYSRSTTSACILVPPEYNREGE